MCLPRYWSETAGTQRYPGTKATESLEKGGRKSECSIIPMKRGNSPHGDPVEGREHRIMELLEGKMEGTPSPETVPTKLQKVADLARKASGMAFRPSEELS